MLNHTNIEQSLWKNSAKNFNFKQLTSDIKVEVLVIGGGFTGCSAALHLAKNNISVALIEAKEIGNGASGRNVGLINPVSWISPNIFSNNLGKNGEIIVRELANATNLIYELIEEYNIECELRPENIIRLAHNNFSKKLLKHDIAEWKKRSFDCFTWLNKNQISSIVNGYLAGYIDQRSSSVNPMALIQGLANAAQTEGAYIYQNVEATKINSDNSVIANGHIIIAKKIIVATESYSSPLFNMIQESLIPMGCFCIASEPQSQSLLNYSLYDTRTSMRFIRTDKDNRIIVGSLGFLPDNNKEYASKLARSFLPNLPELKWQYSWSGIIGLSKNYIPRIYRLAPNIFTVVGYNGRGISPGIYFGKYLAELIIGYDRKLFAITKIKKQYFRNLYKFLIEGYCIISRLFL